MPNFPHRLFSFICNLHTGFMQYVFNFEKQISSFLLIFVEDIAINQVVIFDLCMRTCVCAQLRHITVTFPKLVRFIQ